MEKEKSGDKREMYRQRLICLGRTALIVLAASLISLYLNWSGVMKENILMVLLIGVLLTGAFTSGYEYGVIGAVASVLIFNFFFTVPVHTFAIMNPDDVVLMAFFLAAAFISSGMTARFRRQAAIAGENERTARKMSELSERFINVTGEEQIIALGVYYIRENTGYEASVRLTDDETANHTNDRREIVIFPIGGIMHQTGELRIWTKDRGTRYLSARWQDRWASRWTGRRFIPNRRRPGCRWSGSI